MPSFLILLLIVGAVWIGIIAIVGLVVVTQPSASPIKRYPLIVLYACLLHFVWAASLIADPTAGEATSMSGLLTIFGPRALVYLLILVATLALAYVFLFSERRLTAAIFVFPQQAVLFVSAWTALAAMLSGRFADGVERPVAFIVADQAPAVLAAALHAAAIVIALWQAYSPRSTTGQKFLAR